MLHYRAISTQPSDPQQGPVFDFGSFLGLQIGQDTSNTFAVSVAGLAIRTDCGRYVVKEPKRAGLLDVTFLVMPGIDPVVFRIPVHRVHRNDLIVISDAPLTLLYVLDVDPEDRRRVRGLNPMTGEITRYRATDNLFVNFFVKVVSLFDLLSEEETYRG